MSTPPCRPPPSRAIPCFPMPAPPSWRALRRKDTSNAAASYPTHRCYTIAAPSVDTPGPPEPPLRLQLPRHPEPLHGSAIFVVQIIHSTRTTPHRRYTDDVEPAPPHLRDTVSMPVTATTSSPRYKKATPAPQSTTPPPPRSQSPPTAASKPLEHHIAGIQFATAARNPLVFYPVVAP